MSILSPEAAEFLEAPHSMMASGCSAKGVPSCARALGLRCDVVNDRATVWIPAATSQDLVADLRATGQMALVGVHLLTNRSVQIKGRVEEIRTLEESERPVLDRKLEAFVEACELLGLPRTLTGRLSIWPAVAVELKVTQMFDQTPGPGAGGGLDRRVQK